MGYKVRVVFRKGKRKRDYGTGEFGKGKAYKTRQGAEKRLEYLTKLFRGKVALASPLKIIRTDD